ncbi:unnamed protein product [Triticum turgidum subsp. durum]|uniref:Uncharacterized protein n=1 Tax=Triticum turgidum subsp. durum TaxID=4567 RepID=A0A9R0YZU7_TRITD|nr:unnamed protein product [Triticum turgidum subsp. durum]
MTINWLIPAANLLLEESVEALNVQGLRSASTNEPTIVVFVGMLVSLFSCELVYLPKEMQFVCMARTCRTCKNINGIFFEWFNVIGYASRKVYFNCGKTLMTRNRQHVCLTSSAKSAP